MLYPQHDTAGHGQGSHTTYISQTKIGMTVQEKIFCIFENKD